MSKFLGKHYRLQRRFPIDDVISIAIFRECFFSYISKKNRRIN